MIVGDNIDDIRAFSCLRRQAISEDRDDTK